MSKLVEATHVTLGGEIGSPDAWRGSSSTTSTRYTDKLLTVADALLLGRLDLWSAGIPPCSPHPRAPRSPLS
jgi:hypothetical protein